MERTWTRVMIVLGADAHKRSHTIAAVEAATGQVLGDKTTAATARGFGAAAALAAWIAIGSGRWRIAGTCPAAWSGS